MIHSDSAKEYCKNYGIQINKNTDIEDIQFGLQLIYMYLNIDPINIQPDLPFSCLKPGNLFQSIFKDEFTKIVECIFAKYIGDKAYKRYCLSSITFRNFIREIGLWREIAGLFDKPWNVASKKDILKITTFNKPNDYEKILKSKKMLLAMNEYGGLNICHFGKIEDNIGEKLSVFLLLCFAARKLLTYEEFRCKYYPDSLFDEKSIAIILNVASYRIIPGLLRPEDRFCDYDDIETNTINSMVCLESDQPPSKFVPDNSNPTLIRKYIYEFAENIKCPDNSQSELPLLHYPSLHYLITQLEYFIVKKSLL